MTEIRKANAASLKGNRVLLTSSAGDLKKQGFTPEEAAFIAQEIKNERKLIVINRYAYRIYVQMVEKKKEAHRTLEAMRKAGNSLVYLCNKNKIKEITLINLAAKQEEALALAEGMALGNYQFLKYKTDTSKSAHTLKTIFIAGKHISEKEINLLQITTAATCRARDLVNEPPVYLTPVQLSKEFQAMAKESGFSIEVFNKSKIESLKMGGLLAVNRGSADPPTFSIMEWKPRNAKNKKPYVLVGKGVTFDTGGMSLKPTAGSMDSMKCDMAGSAVAACTLYAVAKAKLPLYVVAIVPATDNRPDANAYVPCDVITMYSGLTVEVLNTDAEGRLILGDALHYAKKFNPHLVIDIATLTGAARAAIGQDGIVCMGNADERTKNELKKSGNSVYERLVEFPIWEEYGEYIKSDVAEIKNTGGPFAGAITAGKFLERFTDYPWIHLDIAGPAFISPADSYRGKNGTGIGVRLLFDFLRNRVR
jgi:leucyl aminopeptidase